MLKKPLVLTAAAGAVAAATLSVTLLANTPSAAERIIDCGKLVGQETQLYEYSTQQCLLEIAYTHYDLTTEHYVAFLRQHPALGDVCHAAAHVTGERKFNDAEALAAFIGRVRDFPCDGGIIHGALMAVGRRGPIAAEDVAALAEACVSHTARDESAAYTCVDGFGHMSYLGSQGSFDRAFSYCEAFEEYRQVRVCYEGAAMEAAGGPADAALFTPHAAHALMEDLSSACMKENRSVRDRQESCSMAAAHVIGNIAANRISANEGTPDMLTEKRVRDLSEEVFATCMRQSSPESCNLVAFDIIPWQVVHLQHMREAWCASFGEFALSCENHRKRGA